VSDFLPRGFVEQERRRVFKPDASFPLRVVLNMSPVSSAAAPVWDLIPASARRMVAVMSLILVVIVAMQFLYSEPPEAGIVDAYLEPEMAPADRWLYDNAELPEDDDLLLEISLVGNLR
jgi:hypothetical protein